MTPADVCESVSPDTRGEVRFLDASARVRLQGAVEAAGWVLVQLPPLGPGARGQLATRIEETLEDALQRRGASPPGVGAAANPRALLEDQLYRAQQLGVKGIAVALDSLSGLSNGSGALGADDSECLRFWAAATRHHPIALWLAPTDLGLPAYGPPIALKTLLVQPSVEHPSATAASDEPARQGAQRATNEPRAKKLEGTPAAWKSLARALEQAEGPKPLGAIERLFLEAYVPLSALVARGETEPRARDSLARFSQSFEKSYTEAFAAAKVTKKRPSMVLDVPQVAARIARLHGARNVVLVLVDGMRYDVGLRVEELLQGALRGRAVLAERTVLWAALPTTTAVQLRLMNRGPQGLTEPLDTPELREQELVIPHGRRASVMRRLRIGGREIQKLDLIPANLGSPGLSEVERIESLAQSVSLPLAHFAESLTARTLMFVFGDHGFVLPRSDVGTDQAEQGGARPEEVLVPAQGWILGGVH